ncbi:MAG: aminotransferase class IV family protein [Deltaproteobacteria bacterium]|nr:aminotransferase class IV family protein [Deltaproteobacteria bacterium]
MNEFVCLNGKLIPAEDARVSIYDAGFLHGVGLFETMRAYRGRVFRPRDHFDRLGASAQQLGLRIAPDSDELAQWLATLLDANELTDARVRLTATPGDLRPTATTATVDPAAPPSGTLLITATSLTGYPDEFHQRGITVVIADTRANPHDPTAGHKTLNYFPRLLTLQRAQQKGAAEALWFTPANRLACGCISNVFAVKGDTVFTPPAQPPVRPGITRNTVLDLCQQESIAVQETDLVIQDLLDADEIFLTNSIMELLPVCRVERHAVGQDKPGPVYKQLRDAYHRTVQQECLE